MVVLASWIRHRIHPDRNDLDKATLQKALADANEKIETLSGKVTEAEEKAKEATDQLNKYLEDERNALEALILERTDFKPDDLNHKSIGELRTIRAAIGHAKIGTGIEEKENTPPIFV
jgi:predicted  nucleic acid-binding Zn-ribbon protein